MGIPQHSLNAGRAVPDSRDHGQEVLFEVATGQTIVAGDLVYSSADSSGRAIVSQADASARSTSNSSAWVAIHGAAAGAQVRCAKFRILKDVNTSAGSAGGAVYLSDTAGGWSATPGTVRVRVGTILKSDATTGVVELMPQATFNTEALGGIFVSGEISGDGTAQSTAHGLGFIPSVAFVVYTDLDGLPVVHTAGTHTTTNVIFTVTSGNSYRAIAF